MTGRLASSGRIVAAATMLSLPTAIVLAGLVLARWLHPLAAMAAQGAVIFLLAVTVRPYLADLAAASAWARALAAGNDAPPPQLTREQPAAEVVAAIAQLRRAGLARQGELQATSRWNESLFDNLPDPLVLLDGERRVMRANQAARAVFGAKLAGRDLAAFLRDPQVLEATDRVLAGGQGGEVEFTLPVPLERSFRGRVEPLTDGSAANGVAILALHDLTNVKRLEKMRADFVANASHELRTPLATLLGFIETLRGPARDDAEARDRFLAIMFDQGSRMARLVNDLLSLSRIELNEHSRPNDKVDLAAIVEAGLAAMAPLLAAKSVEPVVELAANARMALGQADELAQVVQNLLDNAVKYGRDGTQLRVTLSLAETLPHSAGPALIPGQALRLAVEDHGDGIAKEHLPRLTERFYRVDTARSRSLGGTGLGLAIVKHIINRHRGVLNVESVVGKGSTFSVYLPGA